MVQALAKRAFDQAGLVGWWVARLAPEREQRLHPPQYYLRPPEPAADEAMASAMFDRMAADWGLEVEGIDEGSTNE